jgi:hypothetical protein
LHESCHGCTFSSWFARTRPVRHMCLMSRHCARTIILFIQSSSVRYRRGLTSSPRARPHRIYSHSTHPGRSSLALARSPRNQCKSSQHADCSLVAVADTVGALAHIDEPLPSIRRRGTKLLPQRKTPRAGTRRRLDHERSTRFARRSPIPRAATGARLAPAVLLAGKDLPRGGGPFRSPDLSRRHDSAAIRSYRRPDGTAQENFGSVSAKIDQFS